MLTDLGAVEAATKLEMEAGPSLPSTLPACLPASVEDKPGLAKVRCFTKFILGSFGENIELPYIQFSQTGGRSKQMIIVRCRSIRMIICKRLVYPDDHLHEASPSV